MLYLNAKVTLKVTIKDICTRGDLNVTGMDLKQMVEYLVRKKGIKNIVENDFEIFTVEEC